MMMEKKQFFEVFPMLKLDKDLTAMFEQVEVTKVTSNLSHDKIRIYIESSRLIEKSAIYTVKEKIANTLRLGKKISIEFVEKYYLSKQYTTENLLEIYKDSIIMELDEKSPIVATMFKSPNPF